MTGFSQVSLFVFGAVTQVGSGSSSCRSVHTCCDTDTRVATRSSPISEFKHFGQLPLSWALPAVPEAAAQIPLNAFPNLTCQPQCCFMVSITREAQLLTILSGAILLQLLVWYQFSFQFLLQETHCASLTHLCCVFRDNHKLESRVRLLSPLCSTWWMPSLAVGYWVWHMLWQTLEWSVLRKNAQFPSHQSLIYSFVIYQPL